MSIEHLSLSVVDGMGKLQWNPAYCVEVLDNERVFLYSECKKTILKGEVLCVLAPLLLSGEFSADELAAKLEGEIETTRVYYTLSQLEEKKLIQTNSRLLSPELAAYCGLLDVSEEAAFANLKAVRVFLQGEDGFKSLLARLSIQLVDDMTQADFSIVCVHDYLQLEAFRPINKPWLICRPYGSEIWIGPFFDPSKKACYECLVKSLNINRLEESYLQHKQNRESFCPPFHAMLETTRQLAWNLTAIEVFKRIILGKSAHLEGRIQTFNTIDLNMREHLLINYPTCRCCGDPQVSHKSSSITLEKRKKEEDFRSLSPEETVKKFEPYISPIIGVVKYLKPSSHNSPIHVYYSGSNCGLPDFQKGHNMNTFRMATGGKGVSEVAAKASGLCEALERSSGFFQGDEEIIYASFKQLEKEAIHPAKVSLFSERQYKNREKLNAESHSFWKIPIPLSDEKVIAWTPVFSLTENRIKYYPTDCCYYGVPEQKSKRKGHCDSNGCAAGNYLEEAILQGFLELVERDSVAIWWYNRLTAPSVDLASFQIPYIESLLQEYALRNREVWVLDITTDLGIPTFAALSRLKDKQEENIFIGFGAHLEAEIAILRSLTEMNQFLDSSPFWQESHFGEGKQDFIDKKIISDWFKSTKVKDHAYLRNALPIKKATEYPKWKTSDLLEDINYCRRVVESRGMEFLVLDQTRSEIGLSVVRVIVPGLRHFWPRFAEGRLYDVPVKMQKLKAPLKETDLNPIGMFL